MALRGSPVNSGKTLPEGSQKSPRNMKGTESGREKHEGEHGREGATNGKADVRWRGGE